MSKAFLVAAAVLTGGVALLLWRRSASGNAPSVPVSTALCDGVQAISTAAGYPIPSPACQLVHNGLKSSDTKSEENRLLNGGVVLVEVPDALRLMSVAGRVEYATGGMMTGSGQTMTVGRDGTRIGTMLQGNHARYGNGCEPFKGAPGWGKCAPGTHEMSGGPVGQRLTRPGALAAEGFEFGDLVTNPERLTALFAPEAMARWAQAPVQLSQLLSGTDADPMTITHVPLDGKYYVAGKPLECPAGAPLVWLRDKRDGVSQLQTAPGVVGEAICGAIPTAPDYHDGIATDVCAQLAQVNADLMLFGYWSARANAWVKPPPPPDATAWRWNTTAEQWEKPPGVLCPGDTAPVNLADAFRRLFNADALQKG